MMDPYKGFWSHRGSNDLVFVVTEGPNWVVKQFGSFLLREMTQGVRQVHFGSIKNDATLIFPNWEKLISIEVQTKKWMEDECDDLHIKFYFEKSHAKANLKHKFKNDKYEHNLDGIVSYWKDDSVGQPNEVFSPDNASHKKTRS